jgi:hypothetical protein
VQWIDYTVGPEGLTVFDIRKRTPFLLPPGRRLQVAATEQLNLNGGRLVRTCCTPPTQLDVTWDFQPSGKLRPPFPNPTKELKRA